MPKKHFMDKENAVSVLTPYANKINNAYAIVITWEAFQALTETEKAAHRYIIRDYPSQGIIPTYALYNLSDVNVNNVENGNLLGFDITSGKWVPIEVDTTVTEDSTNPITSGAVKSAIDNTVSNIAMTETTNVATVAHVKDSYFIDSNGQFVKATTDIAIGATIAVGTNVTVTTIAEAINSLNTIVEEKSDEGTIPVNPSSTEGMNIWIVSE